MEQEVIQTNKGNTLIRINYNCKIGDEVFYVYDHSNGTEHWNRIIPAKFVRYTKNKEIVIIQRSDTRKNSQTRTSILKVFIDIRKMPKKADKTEVKKDGR
jgi:hypothetical protein